MHDSLKPRDLLPAEHLVDKGYTDAHVLVDSQRQHGVTIVGPVAEDPSWQARGGGFDKGSFIVDWERHVVTCPAGKQSISWLPNTYPQNGVAFEARFSRKDCGPCPNRMRCTKSKQEPRIIRLQARAHHEALSAARQRQKPKSFGASTPPAQASRQRTSRRSGAVGCGGAVILGSPRHVFSMC